MIGISVRAFMGLVAVLFEVDVRGGKKYHREITGRVGG